MRMHSLLWLTGVLALLSGTGRSADAQKTAPRGRWPTATPSSVGINRAALDSIDEEIRSGQYGYIDRMLVIREGKVVFDRAYPQDYVAAYGDSARIQNPLNAHDPTGPFNYFNDWWHPFYRRGRLHTLQSVTKTVSSVIIGTAVTRGDFPSLDTPVLRFFDTTKVANIDDRKRRLTIRHLLTMTGGLDWNESLPYIDPRNTAHGLEASADWIQFTIDRPMMREPGTAFNYSSGESALIAHVFRQATGWDIEEYGATHLFAPLGITEWFWKRTPSGTADTEGGLYLAPEDLARIWYLFLLGGEWQGTRVLTADWVRESVTPQVAVGTGANATQYGLLWWLYRDPTEPDGFIWTGSGFGGQFPMAFPARDMVVVFNGWNILPRQKGLPFRQLQERLARAAAPRRARGAGAAR